MKSLWVSHPLSVWLWVNDYFQGTRFCKTKYFFTSSHLLDSPTRRVSVWWTASSTFSPNRLSCSLKLMIMLLHGILSGGKAGEYIRWVMSEFLLLLRVLHNWSYGPDVNIRQENKRTRIQGKKNKEKKKEGGRREEGYKKERATCLRLH